MPPLSRVSAGAAGFARGLPLAFASATIAASLVVDRRGDHDEGQVAEAAIVNGVGGPGRNEDDVVLAHHPSLAVDLHQPLAVEHVVDLLLPLVGVRLPALGRPS